MCPEQPKQSFEAYLDLHTEGERTVTVSLNPTQLITLHLKIRVENRPSSAPLKSMLLKTLDFLDTDTDTELNLMEFNKVT